MPPPLMLIDGHNVLWRTLGFPAHITSRDGQRVLTPVFAFLSIVRAAIRNFPFDVEVVVCFDGENGRVRRQDIDNSYKSHRPDRLSEPAATLLAALGDIKRGLESCEIPWVEISDEEADDVIASIVHQNADRKVGILSRDKDYYQLLNDKVRILNASQKMEKAFVSPGDVVCRYGVTPRQWCDFRALTGDPSDGIAGIRGIGPITAARLLADGLLLEDLPLSGRLVGRSGKAILDKWEQLLCWRDLMRMRTDVPINLPLTGLPLSREIPTASHILDRLGLW